MADKTRLETLSHEASSGEWWSITGANWEIDVSTNGRKMPADRDALFIVELVNAYRRGDLVETTKSIADI